MDWSTLPKDIQIAIVKRFDMDTRIKLGLIRKLCVPETLKFKLSAVCNMIMHGRTRICVDDLESVSAEVNLGSRQKFAWAPKHQMPIYTICFQPEIKGYMEFERTWTVIHNGDKLHSYKLGNNVWTHDMWSLSATEKSFRLKTSFICVNQKRNIWTLLRLM